MGTHLFGNNVDEFFNIRENDNGEGKWEIILENPKVEDWLTIDVYLIPIEFEIDWEIVKNPFIFFVIISFKYKVITKLLIKWISLIILIYLTLLEL